MPMNFNLYVPGEYTFKHYFLPQIKNPNLEWFEVDTKRFGVQRKGNNHLVVFLDFCLKRTTSKFTSGQRNETGEFLLEAPEGVKLFNKVLGHHKEVSVFSLSYHARMSVVAWRLLIDIVDDEKILVEDGEGNFRRGPEVVKELKQLLDMA